MHDDQPEGEGRAEDKLEFDVYEVFAQTDPMGHHEHQFSLLASSPELALALAQENFLRRSEILSIWAVRRDHIVKTRPQDRLRFARLEKGYRMKQSYSGLTEKWRKYKEHPMPEIPLDGGAEERNR
jgi:ring-1,2-phenylacetyl-CoA epoxidase subunit PaaB